MAHPLHHSFGSVHLFLLSPVLCSHTGVVLSAMLEKMDSAPNREGNHANVKLGRALISGLVHLRCMKVERCMPKVEQQYPHRDIPTFLCLRGTNTESNRCRLSSDYEYEPEMKTCFGRSRLNQSVVYTYLLPPPFLSLTSKMTLQDLYPLGSTTRRNTGKKQTWHPIC